MTADEPKIKAVVFDHGGVLTRGGAKGTLERFVFQAMNFDGPLDIEDLGADLKVGHVLDVEYVNAVNERHPNAPRPLTDSVWDDITASLFPDHDAYDFAVRCRRAGLRVAMLSTIVAPVADRLRARGCYDDFDPVVLSCDLRFRKPDREAYAEVEDLLCLDADPEEILLLDDQEKCCAGARACGWQAIRVDSTEQMIRDASALLGMEV